MTSSEEFNCLFCQDFFESKEELQIHFRKHGDPKFNQSVKSKPQAEMSASGDKAEEGEVVNCDVCEEVFPTISKAITHKHKVHPDHDAKYFCPWCGKLFTMKHLYNKHIQTTHNSKEQSEETGFHCDYCEVDFFVPSAMVYHNKFFHRQDTELAAIGHSKKLKMFNQEPLLIYYCPFCGEEYCNKVNLHKHMGDDHIDENQSPEDVLRCPLCEAVFYHLDAYELHLTFHSSDDQYSEENELLKEITEFSLETVPPMMEKVENESQDDDPTASVGIEELLLQGMNDSNDCDTNDEPRKKKKHKKHKKSKKTITLDEFLNMHSDVLGEGLDVEGIVEVPSQVVTKQLRKPQPRKQAIKTSTELAKLKKAGIVVKKKPTPTTLKGMKIANKKPVVNTKSIVTTAQVGSRLIPPTQSKTDAKISSKDILSKLLSQSNSQIKIVKKSAGGITETGKSDKQSNEDSEKLFDDDNERIKNGTVHDTNNKTNVPSNESNHENCEKDDMAHQSDGCSTHDVSSQESDNQCSTKDSANCSQVNIERKFIRKSPLEEKLNSDKPLNNDNIFEEQSQVSNTMHGPDAVNPLRNISQHITIKSLSSPKTVQLNQKQPVKEIHHSDTEDDNEGNNISNDDASRNDKSPLAALKHLSNLTIKSANQSKFVSLSPIDKKEEIIEKHIVNNQKHLENSNIDEEHEQDEFGREPRTENNPTITDYTDSTAAKLNALKNLSKHITVKSMPQSPNSLKVTDHKKHENVVEEELEHGDLNVNKHNIQTENINFQNKQTAIKNIANFKSPGASLSSPNNSPKVLKTQPSSEMQNKKNELVLYNPKDQTNVNILKQFPNVTAKPINMAKNFTQKVTVQSSTNVQKGFSKVSQCTVKKLETKQKQEIEIFNIEDSDDEDERNVFAKSRQNNTPTSFSRTVEDTKIEKSMEVLKNLGKNITIKPKNPQASTKLIFPYHDEMFEDEPQTDGFENDFDENSSQNVLENQVNTLLQNKLKSLGSITMKSNSSPKIFSTLHNSPKVKINPQIEEYDSDPETHSKVKITELPEDYHSDEDIPLNDIKNNLKFNANKQEAEDDMESNNDPFIEDDDDIETHIKPCTLKKPVQTLQKTPTCLNKLKNLTVKSLKESNQNIDQEIPDNFIDDNSITHNKKLNTPPFRQDISEDENQESTSNKPVTQQLRRVVNQNAATSPNLLSTINKEVKVQTYQTKTVIEEVTTTVTKTIRTVNQTTNQEVQNVSQIMSMNTRPQKIQGIRPNQQVKNFQGMSVRPAAPIRPRMRHPVMPTRPPGSNIRPSNQLVPIRPGANVARLSNPRMPAVKKNMNPSTSSPNKPVVGKPLKISPHALVSVNKRSAPEEACGPFSCFKKPKESLIPGLPSNFADDEGDSAVQFASSSHTSRSNFTSMKTVKGNNLVTSTQMKSEVSSSSEQLSRLNSMSGLKVVKTSQVKQASQVEERMEVDPAQQSTLSAIERLQKQGLLIKKPRVEEPDSDHSNPDDGDNYYDT